MRVRLSVTALTKYPVQARQNAFPGAPLNVDLRGCLFLARNKHNKELRSMCNNCRKWTQKMGIVDLHPA